MEKDHPYGGPTRYYYADNLSFVAKLYTVLSVIGSILSTPLVLLCCIPTIISIKKVRKYTYYIIHHSCFACWKV